MRFNKLVLNNFGIFSGQVSFDFNCAKPVVLIGGMNGRGKTTVVEAVLLALYGQHSFVYEASGLSFGEYLKQHINKLDNSQVAWIELEFTRSMPIGCETYSIRREWDIFAHSPYIKTTVLKNSIFDHYLSENWDYFAEDILPNAISPYFFFDGEKISDLANADDDTRFKEAIKVLLGINIIDTAITDLQRILKRHQISTSDENATEIEELKHKVNETDERLKAAKELVGQLDVLRIQLEARLKIAEKQFTSIGGALSSHRSDLINKRSKLLDDYKKASEALTEVSAGSTPLIMVMPLLNKALNIATAEKEQRSVQSALEMLPSWLQEYVDKNHLSMDTEDFLGYVRQNVSGNEPILNLSDSALAKLSTLCMTLHEKTMNDVGTIFRERNSILAELMIIDDYLANYIDDENTDITYKKILEYTASLATVNEQLRNARIVQDTLEHQFSKLLRQQTDLIEKTVANMEVDDDNKRIFRYAGYAIEVFEEFGARLQMQKTTRLAIIMSDCFKRLVSKSDLITRIEIEAISLRFHYFNKQGDEIKYSSLSAGEKQLLVISMLWALRICSKKEFPIVIDTPLARLDSSHREALTVNYFPNASEQTILLSTDKEIDTVLYKQLTPFIGCEYTLVYDDAKMSSTIEKGYFGGNLNDC